MPSIHANCSPMHTRGPPPNGKYANFGRSAWRSGENRSGSNRSGSGNHRASRCMTYCDMSTIERARNLVSVRLERRERASTDDPRRRVEPHGLRQDHARVRQRRRDRRPSATGRLTPSRSRRGTAPRRPGAATGDTTSTSARSRSSRARRGRSSWPRRAAARRSSRCRRPPCPARTGASRAGRRDRCRLARRSSIIR